MNKKVRRIVILIMSILIILSMFLPMLASVHAAEVFNIENYHVSMNVNEDGSIDVTESMSVKFEYSRHGIYFNIPTEYKMTWDIDGNVENKEYYYPVSNIKVLSDHEYDVENYDDGVQIKLGSGDYYANEYETYIIGYTIQTRDLGLDERQMFYMNLIGKWDTIISHFSFDIQLPKDFDESKIEFYLGANLNNIQYVSYEVASNKISGEVTLPISNLTSFTIMIPLDDGYFSYKELSNYNSLVMLLGLILVAVSGYLFMKHGKDDPIIIPVEFSAPEGISSAEVGYIIDGSVDVRDIVSLILDWGNKGLVTISEEDNDLTFTKVRDIDETSPFYEKRMFNALFEYGDVTTTDKLREKFYVHINQASQDLNRHLSKKENRIFSKQSIFYRILVYILASIPSMLYCFFVMYAYYWKMSYGLVAAVVALFPLLWVYLILSILESKEATYNVALKLLIYLIAIVALVVNGAVMLVCTALTENSYVYPLVIWLSTIVLSFIGMKMIKRTERGTRLYGQVLGLREFILYAEYDRLKAIVDEDPYVFYSILPYAYAMDLTDIWTKHFKKLEIPEVDWYVTSTPMDSYMRMRLLSSSMHSAQRVMVTTPPQTSSGGGSFSGGSSGGGFSGGGFGGSSGGSW